MYDPVIGQFISEDPIGFDAGDPNLRRYVGNSAPNDTDPSGHAPLSKVMLDKARAEMKRLGLSDAEVDFRIKILQNVSSGKTYFPDPDNVHPETRNTDHWELTGDGYVPKGLPSDAIDDLWKSENGIQCNKYSALVIIKTYFDFADPASRARLNGQLSGKVIPNDLPGGGRGTFFTFPDPKNGDVFDPGELIPGDQVWFENPYFGKLKPEAQDRPRYTGEQGSNVYYVGNGHVIDIYGGNVMSIQDYRDKMLTWNSVADWNRLKDPPAMSSDFQIRSVRRPITPTK